MNEEADVITHRCAFCKIGFFSAVACCFGKPAEPIKPGDSTEEHDS